MTLAPSKDELEAWNELAQILALILGAGITYWKWVRGRLFKPRMALEITAKRIAPTLILASVKLTNSGAVKCDIQQERGTGVKLSYAETLPHLPAMEAVGPEWTPVTQFEVFLHHGFVESGESITDQVLVQIGSGLKKPLKLELILASHKSFWRTHTILLP